MKITLFLMTYKGLEVLRSIIINSKVGYIDKVIIGIDNDAVNDYSKEIEMLCKQNNINFWFNNEKYSIESSYGIAISWRWLINQSSMKLIVLHDSLLPKYRGFAPLVNMLINGEKKIGVTALFACDQYDRGDIILQREIDICYPIKIEFAIERISLLYSEIILEIINILLENKELKFYTQDDSCASYSLWRDCSDYVINWSFTAKKIKRFIDAVGFPYAGAKTNFDGRAVTITDSEFCEDVKIENRDVGKIIFLENQKPIVVCGKGLLRINEGYFEDTGKSLLPLRKFRVKFF